MADIILHHYPVSPYAEKIRLGLGLKGLAWKSVIIPMIMPKPDLMPLTGGYRKTPVLQIGADIYCDTQLILRELERRFPEPSFYPAGSAGLADAFAFWAEKFMFSPAVGIAFALADDAAFDDAFKQDRAKFSGRDFDVGRMRAALPKLVDQLRAHLAHLDTMLADGRKFLFGDRPGLGDLAPYHCLWFVAQHAGAEAPPLKHLPRLRDWMGRMAAIGHGRPEALDSKAALEIARSATPQTKPQADAADPEGRQPGDRVSVVPDDSGRDPVAGELVAASAQEIAIRRTDKLVGEVMVHFPRAGFIVSSVK
ncbi:MAG: glutathione S-transferase family protein [Reyranellaceae bacterium]